MHMGAECDGRVGVEGLKRNDGGAGDREIGEDVAPLEAFDRIDRMEIDGGADCDDGKKFEEPDDAAEHDRRDGLGDRFGGDRAGEGAQLANAGPSARRRDCGGGGALSGLGQNDWSFATPEHG